MPRVRGALLLALALTPAFTAKAQTAGLGSVSFPTSGAPKAQPAFLRGLALLHSFEYDDAADAFREAQRLDPSFAMAYWGEALTYDHPLWGEHDSTAARAALLRLASTPEARIARGKTPRERAYLTAVEALYGEGTKAARYQAYEAAMARVQERYPDDLDAAALHALALLAIRPRSTTDLRTTVRSAAISEAVLRRNPTHPGATHYLIHAYDDPVLAPLGVPVARRYARIAPRAEHALHMPSHIFVQIGSWDETVASNEAAWTASKAWVKRKRLPNSELDLHTAQWLHYGYLQQGRFARARALADSIDALYSAEATDSMPMHVHMYRTMMGVETVVETGHWDSVPPSPLPSRGAPLYRTALSAYHRGDRTTVDSALARYRRLRDSLALAGDTIQPAVHAMERKLASLQARMADQPDSAVAALARAAELEEELTFIGPPIVPPARELLGELLLELGRLPEAAAAFDATLQRTPNRSSALLGRARTAARAGDSVAEREYYGKLLINWRRADPDLPELAEAKQAVEKVAAAR
jgi:tetratricopeptide (TPR) repeat protein